MNRKQQGKRMYTISEKTKKNIERIVGKSVDQLREMTPDEEMRLVKEKNGVELSFSKERKGGIVGRGNPLTSRRKLRTLEDLDFIGKRIIGI